MKIKNICFKANLKVILLHERSQTKETTFHSHKILVNSDYSDQKQISGKLEEGEGQITMGQGNLLLVMAGFTILIIGMVSWVHACVQIYQIVYFKHAQFTICNYNAVKLLLKNILFSVTFLQDSWWSTCLSESLLHVTLVGGAPPPWSLRAQ